MLLTLAIVLTLWMLFTPKVTRNKEKRTQTVLWQAHKIYICGVAWFAYIVM